MRIEADKVDMVINFLSPEFRELASERETFDSAIEMLVLIRSS